MVIKIFFQPISATSSRFLNCQTMAAVKESPGSTRPHLRCPKNLHENIVKLYPNARHNTVVNETTPTIHDKGQHSVIEEI